MRHALPTVLCALMLAGCASEPGYDKTAMPDAKATARQAAVQCEKDQTPSQFSAAKFMACRLAAERGFAMAIYLRKMDAFETYAAEMMALAADYDAGHISLKRMDHSAASIRGDFVMACNCGLGARRSYDYGPVGYAPIYNTTPGVPNLSLPGQTSR